MNKAQARRHEILSFISSHIQKTGISPTIREIAQAVGLKSPSAVQYHLNILKKQGLICSGIQQNRSIEPTSAGHNSLLVPVVAITGEKTAETGRRLYISGAVSYTHLVRTDTNACRKLKERIQSPRYSRRLPFYGYEGNQRSHGTDSV